MTVWCRNELVLRELKQYKLEFSIAHSLIISTNFDNTCYLKPQNNKISLGINVFKKKIFLILSFSLSLFLSILFGSFLFLYFILIFSSDPSFLFLSYSSFTFFFFIEIFYHLSFFFLFHFLFFYFSINSHFVFFLSFHN